MDRAAAILREHPVNRGAAAAGKPAATSVWFWGQGRRPAVPTLKERFSVEGSVISAVDLVNGLGRLAGLERITVPGATGFLDTDYAAKARYGLKSLERRDFLLLHIEAPDEAGHMGRADLKREAIERIDELIIGPLLANCRRSAISAATDAGPCDASKLKTHSNEPVPFAMLKSATAAGAKDRTPLYRGRGRPYGRDVMQGYQLIERCSGRVAP